MKTFTFFHSILNNQDKADDHDSKEDIHSKLSNDEMVGCENKEMEDGAISLIIVSTEAKLVRKQAGAELCQAQVKLGVEGVI